MAQPFSQSLLLERGLCDLWLSPFLCPYLLLILLAWSLPSLSSFSSPQSQLSHARGFQQWLHFRSCSELQTQHQVSNPYQTNWISSSEGGTQISVFLKTFSGEYYVNTFLINPESDSLYTFSSPSVFLFLYISAWVLIFLLPRSVRVVTSLNAFHTSPPLPSE